MKDYDRLDRWLAEREADTGDLIYYTSPRFHDVQCGLVIRTGKQSYQVLGPQMCYYENTENILPQRCYRLSFPPMSEASSIAVPGFPLQTEIEKGQVVKTRLKRVK